jgi:DNA helicase II / ATP-dependent DNA helicase PcrA
MEITDRDIERVGLLLFNYKNAFKDEKGERYEFIKCIDRSVDVHACPGSGKTTSLIAKMYLLSEKMPFPDGRGICVLTHTNVAIDTIKKKLGGLGDKLFRHPNFFGTFQTFVDRFLAIPCYAYIAGYRPRMIDTELQGRKMETTFWLKGIERQTLNQLKFYDKANLQYPFFGHYTFIEENDEKYLIRSKSRKRLNLVKPKAKKDWSEKEKMAIIAAAIGLKEKVLFDDRVLSFEDAYDFGFIEIDANPLIQHVFSKRFRFVFIDEMQDSYFHQSEIIDKLFTKDVIIQRIGDLNQSILGDNESETNWKKEGDVLEISGSRRFSQPIANILRTVAFEPQSNLTGKNSSDAAPPYIIPYDEGKENLVLDDFAKLISQYNLDVKAIETGNPNKAVGWIGKEKEGLTIGSYFEGYSKKLNNPRNFPNLITLLACSINTTPKEFRNRLLTAILDILHIEGIKQPGVNRHFTKSSFFDFLDKQFPNLKTKFETRMAWFHMMVNKSPAKLEQIHQKACKFLTGFIGEVFIAELKYSGKRFIEDNEVENVELIPGTTPNVFYSEIPELKHIPIHVGTVHSVKGETHTATLYLETFYYGKTCGEQLIEQIKGVPFVNNGKQKRKAQCIKVAHVGLSRPTDLLCFAMNKKLVDEHQVSLEANGWKIFNVI